MAHLQDQLDEITAQTRNLVQPERLAVGERAIEELFRSGSEDRILPIGATAPEFSLPDFSGRTVRSTDLLALGPLIVNFFRGRWCPYCVTELEAWRDLYPALRERGALVIGISPQTQRQADFTASQHTIPFPLLTDAGCAVAEQFGLVWTVPLYLQRYYRGILLNIPFVNGEDSWKLPLPATYVLSSEGKVLYAEAHADFRVRPEPEEVLRSFVGVPGERGVGSRG
jgi:peroxiredoxin